MSHHVFRFEYPLPLHSSSLPTPPRILSYLPTCSASLFFPNYNLFCWKLYVESAFTIRCSTLLSLLLLSYSSYSLIYLTLLVSSLLLILNCNFTCTFNFSRCTSFLVLNKYSTSFLYFNNNITKRDK
jgi:hypothetical protein